VATLADNELEQQTTAAPQDTLAPAAPLTDQEPPSPETAPAQEAVSPFRAPQTDEEWRQVLAHDRVREHLDRLTQSRADRLLAQQRRQWEQQQQQQQQQRRVEEMDDDELGRYVRENTKLSAAVEQQQQAALQSLYQGTIEAALAIPDALKLPAGVVDRAEYRKVVGSAAKFEDMVAAVVTHLAERMAEQKSDALAVRKAQALYEDRLAKERQKEKSPDVSRGTPVARGGVAFLESWNRMTPRERLAYKGSNAAWRAELDGAIAEAEEATA